MKDPKDKCFIKQAENPKIVEIWIDGKKYVASWSRINRVLIDCEAIAPIHEGNVVQADSDGLEDEEVDERAADILIDAAALAEKRIREKNPKVDVDIT